jgi:hypothetical protein
MYVFFQPFQVSRSFPDGYAFYRYDFATVFRKSKAF